MNKEEIKKLKEIIKMKEYEIIVASRYNPYEGKRKYKVRALSKTSAWDYLKYEVLCTDEYKKVKCTEIK